MSGHYAPVRDLDAEEEKPGLGFPQPEPYAGSTSTPAPEYGASSTTQHDRTPPEHSGSGRAHIRPAFAHQSSATSAYADPWSPGYQRNTSRFSLAESREHLVGDHAKRFSQASSHRQFSSGTHVANPPISKWQNFRRKFRGHRIMERGHKIPGWWASLKAIVTVSWLNILFLVLPVAWYWCWRIAQPFAKEKKKADYNDYVYLFLLAFVAIIPLENIAEFAGEQLALYCGESIGDLIVITLHNVVEVVLAWFLLIKCELKLLQATIVGVVVLHALFVPGIAFLTGGSGVWAQTLKPRVTELNQSLLTVGVLSLVVPAGFFSALPYTAPIVYAPQFANATLNTLLHTASNNSTNATAHAARLVARATVDGSEHKAAAHAMEVAAQVIAVSDDTRGLLLALSRGISVILFVIYVSSRIYLHNPPGGKQKSMHVEDGGAVVHDASYMMTPVPSASNAYFDQKQQRSGSPQFYSPTPNPMQHEHRERSTADLEREHGDASHAAHHEHEPEIGPWPALILLLLSVGMITITAECLVISIKPIREKSDQERLFTDEWFGLVFLPLLSYAGDGLNATMFFIRTKLFSQKLEVPEYTAKAKSIDLAIQFTLLWVPLLVLVSWIINTPLSLLFDHFEIVVIVGACFLVNSVTQDGQTNWAEGLIMLGFYVIIALAAWYYPGDADIHFLSYCKSIKSLLTNSPIAASA